ncbi:MULTISPECIES: hypothetical protein [unclassified Arthrobacter]|uniref:hypothetical protein n=1 Tax=unclassified Arthrobacter TaxID=235627 RepID=UPI000E1EC921|nr:MULTISPECIES: hypothetical protein [unclassified Arthrobacter]MDF2051845.1 hypothetical protein [Arthrobacter sp. Cr_A7]RDV08735.1 hypothetical protein DXK94_17165 [Arthrobacter sp. RT-1]
MDNPDTLILNLTFLGTVGVAFLMFFVLFLLGVITLVLAGVGRLAAAVLMGLFGRRVRKDSIPLVQLYGTRLADQKDASDDGAAAAPPSGPARAGLLSRTFGRTAAGKPRDWRAALKPAHLKSALRTAVVHHPALTAARREPPVLAEDWASAVAEADSRAMARARAAAPEIKLSVRDLPDPQVPAEKVVEVAPLVESSLHNHRPLREVPRSFKKPQHPEPLAPLDTGSLVSLTGPQVLKGSAPAQKRSAPAGTPEKGKQPLP